MDDVFCHPTHGCIVVCDVGCVPCHDGAVGACELVHFILVCGGEQLVGKFVLGIVHCVIYAVLDPFIPCEVVMGNLWGVVVVEAVDC